MAKIYLDLKAVLNIFYRFLAQIVANHVELKNLKSKLTPKVAAKSQFENVANNLILKSRIEKMGAFLVLNFLKALA